MHLFSLKSKKNLCAREAPAILDFALTHLITGVMLKNKKCRLTFGQVSALDNINNIQRDRDMFYFY